MSVSMLDNISYLGKKADNVRSLFNTIDEMVAFNENYLPDVYECNVVEDGNRYKYNRSNSVDSDLGKWRIVNSDNSANLVDYYKKTETDNLLEGYVEKEIGKSLSTNDYTTFEKEKLASLENYDDSNVREHIVNSEQKIEDIQNVIGNIKLNTNAQNLSEAINEVKTNCDTYTSSIDEKVNKNIEDIEKLNGDITVDGSVDKKIETCLTDSKDYTDRKISEIESKQAIVCDEKPIYSNGVTTYVKDGNTETTDEENIWFYYEENNQLVQTIWITGEEITIVSAGSVNFEELISRTKDVVSVYSGDEADTSKIPDLLAIKSLETKLQGKIDTKIDGDAIYDGLDNTSIISALSANQGRILNETINKKLDSTFTGENVANKHLITDSFGNIVLSDCDETISDTSSNAVQNKVVKSALDKKLDITQTLDRIGYVATVGDDGNIIFVEPATLGGSAEGINYINNEYPNYTNVDLALDAIFKKLFYEAPKITSFSVLPSIYEYEIGTIIPTNTITFSWETNKEIKSQTLTDCTIESEDRNATYASELSSTKTFVLTISDGENTVSVNKKISFLNKVYWGSSSEPSEYNNAFVLGLTNNKLISSSKGDYSMNVGDGEYGYFVIPTTMKFSTIWVNGFQADVEEVSTISFTNNSGYTASYTILRTLQAGLGSFVATVK